MVILEFGKQIATRAICQQPREGLKWLVQLNLLNSELISQHLTGRKSELKIPLDGRLLHAANMDLCVRNRGGGTTFQAFLKQLVYFSGCQQPGKLLMTLMQFSGGALVSVRGGAGAS